MARELALKPLEDRQLLFVTGIFRHNGDGERAALDAGYSESTAKQWKQALLGQAHIAWALAVENRKRLALEGVLSINTMVWLRDHAESEKIRAEMAKAIADRAGLVAPRATLAPSKEEKPLHEQSTDELQTLAARLESELAGRAKPVSSAQAAPQEAAAVDLIG